MADVTQEQVVEYIKGISVLELSQLVKALEEELGVSAAAAMPRQSSSVGVSGWNRARPFPSSLVAGSPARWVTTPSAPSTSKV